MMSARWYCGLGIAALCLCCTVSRAAEPAEKHSAGTLVIAGGAVSSSIEAVFQAFLQAIPEHRAGNIAVISAASVAPVESAQHVQDILRKLGVDDARITLVRLAVCDDETTADVDESRWSGNAENPEELRKIASADAFWFTGGDQSRLSQVLFADKGAPTTMLAAIRQRLAEGAAIGGTSAGAAVMSDPMITGGDTLAVLLGDDGAGETLSMGQGFGFFPPGLVDQHFDARARLGRLAVALEQLAPARRLGFGIDEDTALIFAAGSRTLSVVGAGGVVILDGRKADWSREENRIGISGLVLSVLYPGDQLAVPGFDVVPADDRTPTVGSELNRAMPTRSVGMAVPASGLSQLLGEQLLDNRLSDAIERYSFNVSVPPADAEGNVQTARGILYRFSQLESSAGYRGRNADGNVRYTIVSVGFDIESVDMTVTPATRLPPSNRD